MVRISTPKLSEENLLHFGQKLVTEQEKENNPLLGLYRHEGVVLNIETQSLGFQWKFKPPSMEEYHRTARVSIRPITIYHSLWKMVDRGEEVSLDALIENMSLEYGTEPVSYYQSLISHQYCMWLSKYYGLTA